MIWFCISLIFPRLYVILCNWLFLWQFQQDLNGILTLNPSTDSINLPKDFKVTNTFHNWVPVSMILKFNFQPFSKIKISKMNKQQDNKENVFVPPKTTYFIRCPYDNRHFVLNKNYEEHLLKCARIHPNIHVLFCPFNTSHRCRSLEQLVRQFFRQWKWIDGILFVSFSLL